MTRLTAKRLNASASSPLSASAELLVFSVQGNSSGWGMEGSEGRWVRQACIWRSVILNYQVCHDNLTTAADQTDGRCRIRSMRCAAGVVVCVGGRRDGQTRMRSGASPSSPRSSLPQHPPPRGGDSVRESIAGYGYDQHPTSGTDMRLLGHY